jgi:hypothetical protein
MAPAEGCATALSGHPPPPGRETPSPRWNTWDHLAAMTDQPYPDPPRPTLADLDPESATTDALIAMARSHREGLDCEFRNYLARFFRSYLALGLLQLLTQRVTLARSCLGWCSSVRHVIPKNWRQIILKMTDSAGLDGPFLHKT